MPLRPIASHVIFYEACYSGRKALFARDPAGIAASSGLVEDGWLFLGFLENRL